MTTGRTRLEVILELKDKFSAKLKKSQKGVAGFSDRLKSMRGPLLAISAALGGIGIAATKSFFTFDTEMQRIVGLVGVAQESVDGMRKGVLALSGVTAIAPAELASALFAVTSAGQRGDQAMATLRVSAMAAAAGMGETKSVALALVGALQSYGAAGLTASDATDILVATVRAGNLEADTLASQLARIVPIAAGAGVSLEQLGGAIALITRTGASTAETVTGLRAAIIAINAPTTEALTTFEEMGVTAKDLQTALSEKGLVAALRLVRGAAGDNESVFRKMIGSIEGVTAANVLINASSKDLADTFGAVGNAAGVTEEAFQVAADTAEFKFRQAIVDLKVTMVELGATIGPVIAKIAGLIGDLASKFAGLPAPIKAAVIVAGALTLGLAAILLLIPPLIAGIVAVGISLNVAFAGIPLLIGGISIAIALMITKWQETKEVVESVINFMLEGISFVINAFISQAQAIANVLNIFGTVLKFHIGDIDEVALKWEFSGKAARKAQERTRKEIDKTVSQIETMIGVIDSPQTNSLTSSFKEVGMVAVDALLAIKGASEELFDFLATRGARMVQEVINNNRDIAAAANEAAELRMEAEQRVLDFEANIRDIRIFEHNEENRQIVEGAKQRVDDLIAEQDRLEADRRRRIEEAEEAVKALGTTAGFGENVAGFRAAFAAAMARRREKLLAGESVAPLPQGLIDLFLAQGGALFPIGAPTAALPGFSASVEVKVILDGDVFNQAVATAIASNAHAGA